MRQIVNNENLINIQDIYYNLSTTEKKLIKLENVNDTIQAKLQISKKVYQRSNK